MTGTTEEQQDPARTTEPDRRVRRRAVMVGAAAATALVSGTAGAVGGRLTADAGPQMSAPPADGSRFANKVVLITGATSGIGRAAAVAFAAEGAKVGFCGRREQLGRQVEQQIRAAGHEATYVRADVREEDQVVRFVNAVVARYGRLDVVFSNAGIHHVKPVHEITTANWDDVQNTNVRGAYFTLKHGIPHLLKDGGNVVLTASINSIAVRPGFAAYGASKHALIGLMQAAALDYGAHGIRVNAVLPGLTDTEMARRISGTESLPDSVYRAGIAAVARSRAPAAARVGKPEEIAALVVDMASDRFPFMTGSALVIDGGATASLP
ncbi:SDR family NAD(P)-dependent oxidoreductase [Kribbella deserti]|uniref:SDR family NAD(P)-dependent oxidoreductase n=1 Tax=Kribbella deserti TaxID=1926257 RepID=A0ABV6QY28_9ACTN